MYNISNNTYLLKHLYFNNIKLIILSKQETKDIRYYAICIKHSFYYQTLIYYK